MVEVVDKAYFDLIPRIDKEALNQEVSEINQVAKKETKKIEKSWGKKIGARVAGAMTVAGAMAVANKFLSDNEAVVSNIQAQVAIADELGTVATQVGMSNEELMKTLAIGRMGGVTDESVVASLREFAKKFGAFKQTGSGAEFFQTAGIGKSDTVAQAFIKSLVSTQTQTGATRAVTADLFYAGGADAMAELLGQNMNDILAKVKKIDPAVLKGSAEALSTLGKVDERVAENKYMLDLKNLATISGLGEKEVTKVLTTRDDVELEKMLARTNATSMQVASEATEDLAKASNVATGAMVGLTGGVRALTDEFKAILRGEPFKERPPPVASN